MMSSPREEDEELGVWVRGVQGPLSVQVYTSRTLVEINVLRTVGFILNKRCW